MDNFEFLRNVTVGQYFAGDSIIHRLDPRAKITLLIVLVIANGFLFSYSGNLIMLAVCCAAVLASGLPLRFMLSGIKPALPFIVFLAVMQLLFSGRSYRPFSAPLQIYWQWGVLAVSNGSLELVIITFMRFLEIFLLVSLLTGTTTITDLTYAIEDMLRPFQRLGVPAYEISLIGTLALRFVPIFAEQLETIIKAQAARGADLGGWGPFQFVKITRQLARLIVPLFVDAFRRAEDLILAMEARCYTGGRGRTHVARFRMSGTDGVFLAVTVAFVVGLLYFRNRLWF